MKMASTSYKLLSFGKVPSTQSMAQELIAQKNLADRTIVLADVQTAGRGRYRREWKSPIGNLYASFIYKIGGRDPKKSYAVAVAVAETLLSFGIMPSIKWPNDILIDGKKVAGILIEYSKDFMIVGIGINIKTNPKIEKYETAKLHDLGKFSRDEVLAALMKKMDIWLKRDFEDVRDRWNELASGMNKETTYRGRAAIMCGINDNGALVLRRGAEYIMVYGDEISI
jgi:BirA family biotin operon repressor/biotin-[acetyl-CoA-carboxylase] ligase